MRPVVSVMMFLAAVPPLAAQVEIGDRVHITGCENGELTVPTPNIWDSPQQRRVIGRVSGDGRTDQGLRCQGSVVIIVAAQEANGRMMYQIETIVGDQSGWISELFIGRKFDATKCESFFEGYPDAIRKCIRKN